MKSDLSPILNSLHNLIGDHNVKNNPSDYVYDTTQNVPIYLQAEVPPVDPIYDFDIKIDGEHTFEQRPTHCGYSHYLHGESYDVLLDPLNINDKIGVNPGDNVEQVFMEYFKLRGLEGRVNHEELAKHIREKISENEDFRNIVNSKEIIRRKRQKITSQIPPVPKSTSTKPTTTKKPAASKNTKPEQVKLTTSANITKIPSDPVPKPESTLTRSESDIPANQDTPVVAAEAPKPISSKSVDLKNISNEKAMEEWKRRNEENLRKHKEQKEREEKEKRDREIQQMLRNIDNISIQKRLQATNTFIARVQLYGSRSVVGIQCHPGDTYSDLREKLAGLSQIKDYHLVITTGTTHSFVDDDDFVTPMATLIQIPTNTAS